MSAIHLITKVTSVLALLHKEYHSSGYNGWYGIGIFRNISSDESCLHCGSELIQSDIDLDDLKIIYAVSQDNSFLGAMIDLKQKDPIEYQLKLNQLKASNAQIESIKEAEDNTPKCPTCRSSNIEKISLGKKVVGGAMFGLFSSNVRKTMHCNNCGYKW